MEVAKMGTKNLSSWDLGLGSEVPVLEYSGKVDICR
jgi:hypothetical protein